MGDINEYHKLKVYAKQLNDSLRMARMRLKELETTLMNDMTQHNKHYIDVQIGDNKIGVVTIKNQRRYQPLTLSTVRTKISACMNNRFGGGVDQEQLNEFIEHTTKEVWNGRVIKQEEKLQLKLK